MRQVHVCALYEEVQRSVKKNKISRVRVAGKGKVLLPARTTVMVECSVRAPDKGTYEAPVDHSEEHVLPNGLSISPGFITVLENGIIYVQVYNFSNKDCYIHPIVADLEYGDVVRGTGGCNSVCRRDDHRCSRNFTAWDGYWQPAFFRGEEPVNGGSRKA
ncbi:hypothetical protein HOLleu_28789 [Holothuria leucospilota]|uniref:Uncharacterized protein n=1 Tax=Holothuria leucospilota TaxID=206669 RepID=A0A9Q1BMI0_HOLLE|nr:hypothetical protein HOLleu_28789 [Holothuria leucospilota]